MRFASLGSGSRGNATLVAAGDTCLMVDCGFSLRETERRLARLGLAPSQISAILVTHEHGDHLRGVERLAATHGIAVHATPGTLRAAAFSSDVTQHPLDASRPFAIGGVEIAPLSVPHDAAEPCQYTFSDGALKFGLLTDVGSCTAAMVEHFSGCHALMLECNHDLQLLSEGSYPPSLKRRVMGLHGHLSNGQAAGFLAAIDHRWLQHLVAAHLSEANNRPELARSALARVMHCDEELVEIADQQAGLRWRQLFQRL
ncbi:MAG: MBL fold metallo-hydrolase [Pseudomonadales bacterium]|nr:MBL fold metallo-hydrolase [Pseudomonadales bacterium]MCP5333546.1 MBL fold metallo-hydrolase [Pseudomonadales bacterium]